MSSEEREEELQNESEEQQEISKENEVQQERTRKGKEEEYQKAIEIMEKYKTAFELKNDAALARFLEIKPNSLASWKFRGSVNYELLIAKSDNLNLNWLFKGLEPVFLQDNTITVEIEFLKLVVETMEEVSHEENIRLAPKKKSALLFLLLEQVLEDEESLEGLKMRTRRLMHFLANLPSS